MDWSVIASFFAAIVGAGVGIYAVHRKDKTDRDLALRNKRIEIYCEYLGCLQAVLNHAEGIVAMVRYKEPISDQQTKLLDSIVATYANQSRVRLVCTRCVSDCVASLAHEAEQLLLQKKTDEKDYCSALDRTLKAMQEELGAGGRGLRS